VKNPKSKRQIAKSSDVIVIGGGAMGSAAAYELTKRGLKTRLIEQHFMGHDLGSSHGLSRIIRRDYYEHPDYVPLVDRSYALWRELEKVSGESLLTITGIIGIGTPGGAYLTGSALACKLHDIPYERLKAAEIRKRYPFQVDDSQEGVFQKDGGILAIERCIATYRAEAKKLGAAVHEFEEVVAIEPERSGSPIRVRTRKDEYSTEKLVVCAGPWAGRLLKDLNLPLKVERQTLGFYTPLGNGLRSSSARCRFSSSIWAHRTFMDFPSSVSTVSRSRAITAARSSNRKRSSVISLSTMTGSSAIFSRSTFPRATERCGWARCASTRILLTAISSSIYIRIIRTSPSPPASVVTDSNSPAEWVR
jgi:glycine/D-amino acid oxidase-like deaminating enzyme